MRAEEIFLKARGRGDAQKYQESIVYRHLLRNRYFPGRPQGDQGAGQGFLMSGPKVLRNDRFYSVRMSFRSFESCRLFKLNSDRTGASQMKKFGNFSDGPSGLLGAPGMAPENDPRFLQNVPVANGFLTFFDHPLASPPSRPEGAPAR